MGENTVDETNALSGEVIGAAVAAHKFLGPGLLESAYEACLCRELQHRGIPHERQRALPVEYRGALVECGYRLDVVVADLIIVEIKAVEALQPIHQAQLLTYLKLTGLHLGLLLNFNVTRLTAGIKRVANHLPDSSAPSAPLR
jgi:GxxExxY protein